MVKHYLYSASAKKFAKYHRENEIPRILESAYFDSLKAADIVWIVEVWHFVESKEDAIVLGRLVVDSVKRIGRITQIHARPPFQRGLADVSLAKHKLYLDCVSTAGGSGGSCSCAWGTLNKAGGAFSRYDRWVRTGWQLLPAVAERLEQLWKQRSNETHSSEISDPRLQESGAGFGNPNDNQKVEQAAIKAVIRWYEERGWRIQSVEREKCGYDLHCSKSRAEHHVEVKGASSGASSFLITHAEVKCATTDPHFRLVIVANALTTNPVLTSYTSSEFLQRFILEPLSYRARLKSQLRLMAKGEAAD